MRTESYQGAGRARRAFFACVGCWQLHKPQRTLGVPGRLSVVAPWGTTGHLGAPGGSWGLLVAPTSAVTVHLPGAPPHPQRPQHPQSRYRMVMLHLERASSATRAWGGGGREAGTAGGPRPEALLLAGRPPLSAQEELPRLAPGAQRVLTGAELP
ncbi:hypothetical protein G7Z17_g3519 [Cylindrodendrum hubeiense]|uniref:Uncharacterized protein n=1 Tax=Cylindrodendrum hubeiense TaxID=595255 RepID=A0A9P5HHT0_9HYPO|nr:hypothetical protein G7Z17_g3519 [Cylindrodendrum hubeiense]